jgi:branched-chain amino acid transport system permease protein
MVWIETIINGIFIGGLYGLLGLGLALVFGVVRIVNIAHGEFIVLAAFLVLGLEALFPAATPFLLLVPGVLLTFLFGFTLQAVLVNRVIASSRDPTVPMLLTFGISFAVRNLMVEVLGVDPRILASGELGRAGIQIFGVSIGVLPLLTLAISAALFTAAQFVLSRTRIGRIIRATVDDHETMRLMGVRPGSVYNLIMGISLALAGIAGVLLAMRASFTPFSGTEQLLISFEVVVLGGLGSFWGAFAAGLALGVTQLVGLRLDPNSGLLYPHLLFFIGLMLRPNGLFRARTWA